MFVKAARFPYRDALAGKIVEICYWWAVGRANEHLFRLVIQRCGKIYEFLSLGGNRQVCHDNIAKAVIESRQQLVARRRNEHDMDLLNLLLDSPVEIFFELQSELDCSSELAALVDEVDRLAVRHEHTHDAACLHGVEIDDMPLNQLRRGWRLGRRLRRRRCCQRDEEAHRRNERIH